MATEYQHPMTIKDYNHKAESFSYEPYSFATEHLNKSQSLGSQNLISSLNFTPFYLSKSANYVLSDYSQHKTKSWSDHELDDEDDKFKKIKIEETKEK